MLDTKPDLATLSFDLQTLRNVYSKKIFEPREVLTEAIRRAQAASRNEWIDLLDGVEALEKRIGGGTGKFKTSLARLNPSLEALPSNWKDRDELLKQYPLLGVPFAAKDNIAVEGFLLTNGLVPEDLLEKVATSPLF